MLPSVIGVRDVVVVSDVPDVRVIVPSNLKRASVSSSEKRDANEAVPKSAESNSGSDVTTPELDAEVWSGVGEGED